MVVDGVRCVVVDHRLRDLEPLAWNFVCEFARDNGLQVSEKGDEKGGQKGSEIVESAA